MNLLITGGTGFVGTTVVRRLIMSGHAVNVLTRGGANSNRECVYIQGSIESPDLIDLVKKHCKTLDGIVHLATCRESTTVMDFMNTNCLGVVTLLKLAEAFSVGRFVNVSTISVIGKPISSPINEKHPAIPNTMYQASKLLAENVLHNKTINKTSAVSLRITAPIGENMPEGRFLRQIIKKAITHTPIHIFGSGARIQNYVDVEDVSTSILLALNSTVQGPILIGGEHSYSNNEVVRKVLLELDSRSRIEYLVPLGADDNDNWHVDIRMARNLLSYQPHHSLSDTIRRMAIMEKHENISFK